MWIIRRARRAIFVLFTKVKNAALGIGMISCRKCRTWTYIFSDIHSGARDMASLGDVRGWISDRRLLRLRRADGVSAPEYHNGSLHRQLP